jgi:hypothetical protein
MRFYYILLLLLLSSAKQTFYVQTLLAKTKEACNASRQQKAKKAFMGNNKSREREKNRNKYVWNKKIKAKKTHTQLVLKVNSQYSNTNPFLSTISPTLAHS